MKKIFIISLFCNILVLLQAQTFSFTPIIKVDYAAEMKMGKEFQNTKEDFVLLGGLNESYFASRLDYLSDTGQHKAPANPDVLDFTDSSFKFPERIVRKGTTVTQFYSEYKGKIRYSEKVPMVWKMQSDTKKIMGVVCQKATTQKFGRTWIAYFTTEDYQIKTGPYKFYGLPGLILELYDSKNEYHFTATKIKRVSQTFKINLSNYKNYPKKKYLQAFDNMRFSPNEFAGGSVTVNGKKKSFTEVMKSLKKRFNNPIELKPFDN